MRKKAILFIDVDETEHPRYNYREPHFAVARQRGLSCLIAARKGRPYPERLYTDSEHVFLLDCLNERSILDLVAVIQQDYELNAVFCHTGHATRHGQIGVITANVCQALGLPYASADGIDACNNKFVMRRLLAEKGIPSVPYALCNNESQLVDRGRKIGYPLIAKPPFGAGSAFIKKCENEQQLLAHYTTYRNNYNRALSADFFGNEVSGSDLSNIPGTTILLEAWIDGTEGSVECVVTENAVYPLIINEKLLLTARANTVLENLLITPPASFSSDEQRIIREYARRCLQAVGLTHALAHLEFRMTVNGPVVIEINPRLGGLYVSSAFIDIADINPWALYLDMLLGDKNVESRLEQAALRIDDCQDSYSMMVIYPDKEGVFMGFSETDVIKHNPDILESGQFQPGTHVSPDIEEYYLLKCWARVQDAQAALSLYRTLCERVQPIIK